MKEFFYKKKGIIGFIDINKQKKQNNCWLYNRDRFMTLAFKWSIIQQFIKKFRLEIVYSIKLKKMSKIHWKSIHFLQIKLD